MFKTLGVVITYRETEMTKKAIKSLISADVDVALVFNGWDESYRGWLDNLEQYIDFKFLNKNNVGFCRGNNQAMRLAIEKNYDYVFLLNNDAWIEEDCIKELIRKCKGNVGLLQPKVYKAWDKKLLDTTGLIFRYGNKYSWENGLGYVIDRGQNEIDEGQYDEVYNIVGCCACATLYKVKMIKEVGLFWEGLWSQGEDVEFSWRAYKHGWKAKFVPEAVSYHWRGYSLKKEKSEILGKSIRNLKKLWSVLSYRNWALTLLRHGNRKQKFFTGFMWMYVGYKSWFGKRLGRDDVEGKYIWLCSLALLSENYLSLMEMNYKILFESCGIQVGCLYND